MSRVVALLAIAMLLVLGGGVLPRTTHAMPAMDHGDMRQVDDEASRCLAHCLAMVTDARDTALMVPALLVVVGAVVVACGLRGQLRACAPVAVFARGSPWLAMTTCKRE